MPPSVVVGLGNPGQTYARTRHNAGAQALERIASSWRIPLERRNRHALIGQGAIQGEAVALARLRSYMNESGEPVSYLVRRFGIPPQRLLVIYDDLDLPLGALRIRPGGGPGGHKGMASIIQALGTQDFPRLRLGIGRPPAGLDDVIYVLGAFTPPEEEVMAKVRERVVDAVECILAQGLDAAMNRFNVPAPGQALEPHSQEDES